MHRKHGIDRGTEVTEGSRVWRGYPGGVWGAPLRKSYNVLQTHYCTAADFGIWFGVFPIGTAGRLIQLQSDTRRPDCGLSDSVCRNRVCRNSVVYPIP